MSLILRLTKKFYLICIFLCALFSIKAGEYIKADSLFNSNNFNAAAIEYERIYFISDNNLIKNEALLKKAQCYKAVNKNEKALNTFKRINFIGLNDSLQFLIRYEIVLNSYLSAKFNEANAQLDLLKYYIKDTSLINSTLLLQILIYNELWEFEKSKDIAIMYIKNLKLDAGAENEYTKMINSYYSKKSLPKRKNSQKAKALSTFMPGLGQMYAGYPIEGLYNLTIHLALLAFSFNEIIHQYYLTGYFGGFALLQKFYFGGISRAEYLTDKHNYFLKRDFCDEIKAFLMNLNDTKQ